MRPDRKSRNLHSSNMDPSESLDDGAWDTTPEEAVFPREETMRGPEKILSLEGQEFHLLGQQRSGAAVYRGSGSYARVGEKALIESDLVQHRTMEKAKYPVAKIISEGETNGLAYFIEESLGPKSFRAIFQEDYMGNGRIGSENFTQFLGVMKKLFSAQLRSREEEWNVSDFAAGVNVTKLSAELSTYRAAIEERFVQTVERLRKLPGSLQHGDCNPANIYEGGIIDLEDSFKGPIGYDIISALTSIDWSPETRDYEFYSQYRFTEEQKTAYLKAFTTLAKKAGIQDIARHADDLAFCRALWLCGGMHAWPRIQQWRFEKLIHDYLS